MERRNIKQCNSGISLITVVITIVVLIIIASISFYAVTTQESAAVAKYVQEFEELRKNVETKRLINAKERIGEFR